MCCFYWLLAFKYAIVHLANGASLIIYFAKLFHILKGHKHYRV